MRLATIPLPTHALTLHEPANAVSRSACSSVQSGNCSWPCHGRSRARSIVVRRIVYIGKTYMYCTACTYGLFGRRDSTGACSGNNVASRAPVELRYSPSPARCPDVGTISVQGSLERGGRNPSQHCATYQNCHYWESDGAHASSVISIATREGHSV